MAAEETEDNYEDRDPNPLTRESQADQQDVEQLKTEDSGVDDQEKIVLEKKQDGDHEQEESKEESKQTESEADQAINEEVDEKVEDDEKAPEVSKEGNQSVLTPL